MATNNPVSAFAFLFQAINPFDSLGTLIAALTTLLAAINFKSDMKLRPNTKSQPQAFDFIIVGGGTAGGVLANRLSQNEAFQVLVLEAGTDPSNLVDIPFLNSMNMGLQEIDWRFNIVTQVNSCLALVNNSMLWNRGKSLGGTSNLNYMIYMRGNPNDFDNLWVTATNDSQWSYKNILPYFKKSENYHGNYPNDEYHGTGGSLSVVSQSFQPLMEEWIAAGKELGFTVKDPNAVQSSGFSPIDVTLLNGKRWQTYNGFIKPILKRRNLHIIRHAHVTKINLDSNGQATGVTYVRNGETITVEVTKEVILSAGTIGSAQLLLLSGIGPSEQLKSHGVEVKVDLPGVGTNLADHSGSLIGPFLLNDSKSFMADRDITVNSSLQYLRNQTGPLSYTFLSGVAFISTNGEPDWPNVALIQGPNGITSETAAAFEASKRLKPGTMSEYLKGYEGHDAIFVFINVARPKSRGSITLKSNNPFDHPLIDPNYLSEESDLKALVSAFKFLVKLYEETETWKKYDTKLIPRHFPGCESHPLKSDAYYECYVKHFTTTNWHFSSTCKMGRDDDPMAVLTSDLKVRNTSGLRVADASVMPYITNANTNAVALMIAEKAADLILKSWIK